MTRHFWVLLHRYAGLYMAFFLIVAGLTGSILAFRSELDQWLNPETYDLDIPIQDRPLLDPFALRERALALDPGARCNAIPVQTKPGKIFTLDCEVPDYSSKELSLNSIDFKFNPYTGERLPGSQLPNIVTASYWPLTRKNILWVIFVLHFTLLLDELGTNIFGIAALIWAVDCFVGFYLTLPTRRKKSAILAEGALTPSPAGEGWSDDCMDAGGRATHGAVAEENKFNCLNSPHPSLSVAGSIPANAPPPPLVVDPQGRRGRTFWQRWQVAWKVKWPSSTQRLNFDLHRAGGLWFWPFLFIFAWSSVMFNLPEFYESVMIRLGGGTSAHTKLKPNLTPTPSRSEHRL